MKIFNKKQNGFTLVELVVVVAVVGVLAVVATPKIMGVASDARQSTLNGIGGALTAATSRNFAKRSANIDDGIEMLNCNEASLELEDSVLPDGYTIAPGVLTQEVVAIDADGVVTITDSGVASNCTIMTNTSPTLTKIFSVTGIE